MKSSMRSCRVTNYCLSTSGVRPHVADLSTLLPNVGQTVQGWSADGVTDDDAYELVPCLPCTQVHLVNLKTGKVLGEEED